MFKNLKLQNIQNKLKGFTLIELIVVIAIIAILAVIVFPNFQSALGKARDVKRVAELKNIQTDLFMFSQSTSNGLLFPSPLWATSGVQSITNWSNIPANVKPCGTVDNTGYEGSPSGTVINCALVSLYVYNNKSAPKGVMNGEYKYVGTGCTNASTNSNTGCTGYQLWTNLEGPNSVLSEDNDIASASSTPSVIGISVNGANETCTSRTSIGTDCVYDISLK